MTTEGAGDRADGPPAIGRRRLLAALGSVGAVGAFGGGVTAAYLTDRERIGENVVTSGEVRLVDCGRGDADDAPPPFWFTPDRVRAGRVAARLYFDHERLGARARIGPLGVVTNPAWLVARVCPRARHGDRAATRIAAALEDGAVRVRVEDADGDVDSFPSDDWAGFGDVVAVRLDPAAPDGERCDGDVARIVVKATLDADRVRDLEFGEYVLDLADVLVVQRRGVGRTDAIREFERAFGSDCSTPPAPPAPPAPPVEPPERQRSLSYLAFCFDPAAGPVDHSAVTRLVTTSDDGDGPLSVEWATSAPVVAIAYKAGRELSRIADVDATAGTVAVGDGAVDETFAPGPGNGDPCGPGLTSVVFETDGLDWGAA